MKEHRLHYLSTTTEKGNNSIRLRHLKYVRSINQSTSDTKLKRLVNHTNLDSKKRYLSLKVTNKLEVSQPQLNTSTEFNHLYRLAKSLTKVSFLKMYDPLHLDSGCSKQQSLLLSRARNLKSLGFSYEIQDPHFSDYNGFYDTVLALNRNISVKPKSEMIPGSISSTLQQLNTVLPPDIEIVIDFRVSNEILDYPPINRQTHDNGNYIWNLAASYSSFTNVKNLESLLNIRKIFLSCESSNSHLGSFKKFLSELSHIDTLHLQLKKPIDKQIIYFNDLATILKPELAWKDTLKNLTIDCEDIDFDPIELTDIHFPRNLISLVLNFKYSHINSAKNFYAIEKFPSSLEALRNLKILKIEFPTTFLMNQMFHNFPNTLSNMESLHFNFAENTKIVGDEEIYLNSLLECICTMPKLKEFFVKTSKINYTYCAFLSNEKMPSGLNKLQWIEDTLQWNKKDVKKVKTPQWIECKKFEDLNIVLRLLTEKMEHLEIPFVFDGLESDFVALRLLEVLSDLKQLRTLNLALGFKTLDESNIESITNFIFKVKELFATKKEFHMNLNIYYRRVKGAFNIDEITHQNNTNGGRKDCYLQFIQDLNTN